MKATITVLAVICAAVVGLGFWLNHRPPSSDEQNPTHTPANSNYYMEGATVYQLSKKGQLAYRMKVAKALHFPDDSVRLTDIHVHYLAGTTTYWNLYADKGLIPSGQRDLYLYDGVDIHHPLENGNPLKAKTSHAWVRPNDDRIESDAHVTAIEPARKITGDGMHINLNTNKLNLLDNAHVTYKQP